MVNRKCILLWSEGNITPLPPKKKSIEKSLVTVKISPDFLGQIVCWLNLSPTKKDFFLYSAKESLFSVKTNSKCHRPFKHLCSEP